LFSFIRLLKEAKTLRRLIACVVGALLLCGLLVVPDVWAQEDPVVRGYLFYSATCDHCQWVRQEVIPPLYQEFGQQLQIMAVEISDENSYRWWLDVARAYGIDESDLDVPALFIGDDALINEAEIDLKAHGLIQKYLDRGGVDYPDVPRPGGPLAPTVRFMFFWSPTCPHCTYVKENVLPPLKAQYGDRLQWEAYSVEKADNYQALLALGRLTNLPSDRGGTVPTILIGDKYTNYILLVGQIETETYLPAAVSWFMGVGGVDLPAWKNALFGPTSTPAPTATPTSAAIESECTECKDPEIHRQLREGLDPVVTPAAQETTADPQAIHMAYFAEVGCSECDRVSIALDHLEKQFPNLVIHKLDIIEDLSTNLCLSERLNVPEGQRHDAPAVFVGSGYLVDRDIQYERLVEMVSRYEETGAEATWESCGEAVRLPPPPPWWAVILPGLIDGINPCAFATIVFFVSYLTLLERKGPEILMVGLSFTLAVFLSYLAFGMLLREVLAGLVDLVGPVLRPILNVAIALVCLVLAILSLDDYRKARRGRVKDMSLRLPDRLRRWVNAAVRKSMNARAFVLASFVAGVVVSFIELACTGQVYVPIIQGLSNPAYRAQSTLDLVIYCLAFITPLAIVFVASYTGTSSRQLGALVQKHTAGVKLATAVLFLGIGLWLVYDVLRIWGVVAL
jgi:cytochrome c biogenesis protein CcdA/thiol-disulfide isomerase/thioredoxin